MPRIVLSVILIIAVPVVTALILPHIPALRRLPEGGQAGSHYEPGPLRFEKTVVGPVPEGLPRITNVQVVDLDGDGSSEVLVCDVRTGSVLAYRLDGNGGWLEEVIVTDLPAPSHATVFDVDLDGDRDVLVAVLGNIEPDDGVIGQVVLVEREGNAWKPRTILDNVRRVADVQAGDLDGDGDIDLTVAVFGYARGQVLWLERTDQGGYREHELLSAPGVIHVPVVDLDADGDPDIAAIVTQDEEELWAFENQGGGKFVKRRLWMTLNFDLGSAGLIASDMDQDGDVDLILPAGDNLEDLDPYPQPWHGCLLFENQGNWKFEPRRISDLGGTYAAAVGDPDGDGNRDIVLVSMANLWERPERASIVWLQNDGAGQFQTWQIDDRPTHLITVACGDVNGDGVDDIVAGGLHIRGPYDRIGRVTAWISQHPAQ